MGREPKKINNLIVFDFESGGLSATKSAAMSLACIGINRVTLDEIVKYDNLIKPYDKSLEYNSHALAINGLSVSKCERDGIPLSQLMMDFCQVAQETNIYNSKTARPILLAHNSDFDRGFLMECARRTKTDLSKYIDGDIDPFGNFIPHCLDSIDMAKDCWAELTDNTTNFKLGSCCERAGVSLNDGHDALNDCMALADLYRYFTTRLRSGTSEVIVSEGKATASHRLVFEW